MIVRESHKTNSSNNKPEKEYVFTVFTPTYNRKHVLGRVYNSLKTQTFRDFEWIIVDDGSKDGTNEVVEGWKKEADFPIKYYYQVNKGKHIAFNFGVKEARGKLFLPLDSDDACVSNALEKFKDYWESIPEDQRSRFSGVTALCMDEKGIQIGDRFPSDTFDSDALELRFKFRIKGGKWGFIRLDILKEFPFPEIKGTHYVSENIIWNAIAKKYKTRFVNEILYTYYLHDLDTNNLTKQNPAKDAACNIPYFESLLNNDIKWLPYDPKQFLYCSILYCRYCFHMKKGAFKQLRSLKNVTAILLWLCSLPVGYLLYNKDMRKYNSHISTTE